MTATPQPLQPAVAAKQPSRTSQVGNWFKTHGKPLLVGAVFGVALTTTVVMANRYIAQTEATADRQEQKLNAQDKHATKTDEAIEDLEGGYLDLGDSVNAKVPVVSLNYVRPKSPKKEQYSEVGPEDEPVCEPTSNCACESELPVYSIVTPVFTITGTNGGKTDNSFATYASRMLATQEKTEANGEVIFSGENQLVNLGCQPLVNDGTKVVCNSLGTVIRICEEAQPSDPLSCFGGALERLAGAVKLAVEKAAMVYVGLRGNGDCDRGMVRLKEGNELYTMTAYRETGTPDCASAPAGEAPKSREAAVKSSR